MASKLSGLLPGRRPTLDIEIVVIGSDQRCAPLRWDANKPVTLRHRYFRMVPRSDGSRVIRISDGTTRRVTKNFQAELYMVKTGKPVEPATPTRRKLLGRKAKDETPVQPKVLQRVELNTIDLPGEELRAIVRHYLREAPQESWVQHIVEDVQQTLQGGLGASDADAEEDARIADENDEAEGTGEEPERGG